MHSSEVCDDAHNGERGQALVIALLAVAMGTVLVAVFLYYATTSQRATSAAREVTVERYSADAGVEHAMWRLNKEKGFTATVAAHSPVTYRLTSNGETTLITVSADLTATPPSGLPSPWEHRDVGAVAASGAATYTSGVFTVDGSGQDIWDSSDEFHYVYQTLDGDGEIVARVASLERTHPWAKGGVMIRETLDAGAKHALMAGTPDNHADRVTRATFVSRDVTAGPSSRTSTNSPNPSDPFWLRLVRAGNLFTGSWSTDGSNWTTLRSEAIMMTDTVYIGLAVTAHSDGAICTAVFDHVTVTD